MTPLELIKLQMDAINVALASPKKEKTRLEKIVEEMADNHRVEGDTDDLIEFCDSVSEAVNCDHQCSGNCRREGCNCACGEYHI